MDLSMKALKECYSDVIDVYGLRNSSHRGA